MIRERESTPLVNRALGGVWQPATDRIDGLGCRLRVRRSGKCSRSVPSERAAGAGLPSLRKRFARDPYGRVAARSSRELVVTAFGHPGSTQFGQAASTAGRAAGGIAWFAKAIDIVGPRICPRCAVTALAEDDCSRLRYVDQQVEHGARRGLNFIQHSSARIAITV